MPPEADLARRRRGARATTGRGSASAAFCCDGSRSPSSTALADAGRRDLRLYSFLASLDVELLVARGAVAEVHAGYVGFEQLGFAPAYGPRPSRTASVRAFEYSELLFVSGLRASLAGLPFLPTRGARGSDLVAELGRRGGRVPVHGRAPARRAGDLRPDVCVLHAEAADEQGNVLAPSAHDFLFDSDRRWPAPPSRSSSPSSGSSRPTRCARQRAALRPRGRRGRRGAEGRLADRAAGRLRRRPRGRAGVPRRSRAVDAAPDAQRAVDAGRADRWCLARRAAAPTTSSSSASRPRSPRRPASWRARLLVPDVTDHRGGRGRRGADTTSPTPIVRPDDVAAGRRRLHPGRDPRRDPARAASRSSSSARPRSTAGARLNTSRVPDGSGGRCAACPGGLAHRRRLAARRPARRLPRGARAAVPARGGRLRHRRAGARRRDRHRRRRARVGRRPLPPRLGPRGRVGRGRRRRLRLRARRRRRCVPSPSRRRRRRSPSCASDIDPHGLRRLETREGRAEALRALEALVVMMRETSARRGRRSARGARGRPRRPALRHASRSGSVTFGELDRAANRVANALAGLGLAAGRPRRGDARRTGRSTSRLVRDDEGGRDRGAAQHRAPRRPARVHARPLAARSCS